MPQGDSAKAAGVLVISAVLVLVALNRGFRGIGVAAAIKV